LVVGFSKAGDEERKMGEAKRRKAEETKRRRSEDGKAEEKKSRRDEKPILSAISNGLSSTPSVSQKTNSTRIYTEKADQQQYSRGLRPKTR
jgi:hypothetical protein